MPINSGTKQKHVKYHSFPEIHEYDYNDLMAVIQSEPNTGLSIIELFDLVTSRSLTAQDRPFRINDSYYRTDFNDAPEHSCMCVQLESMLHKVYSPEDIDQLDFEFALKYPERVIAESNRLRVLINAFSSKK